MAAPMAAPSGGPLRYHESHNLVSPGRRHFPRSEVVTGQVDMVKQMGKHGKDIVLKA